MTLLNKGLKYNLHHKHKCWIQTLALEADTAINLLDPHEQAYMKQVVTQKLCRLINNNKTQIDKHNTYISRQELTESKLVKKLHEKLEQNNLIVTKADKGRTLIIIQKDVYNQKINDFITQNKFTKVPNNYTKKQQKAIKTAINACKTTIRQTDKWKCTHMNPKAPHMYGTIKLHKADKPIRPIVNCINSPGHKLAGYLVKLLNTPYNYLTCST
jgi:hypothetical protein